MDVSNKYLVNLHVGPPSVVGIWALQPGMMPALTPDDALILAAWLVSIAEPFASKEFSEILEEVQAL